MATALQLGPDNWGQYLTDRRRRNVSDGRSQSSQRQRLLRQVRTAAERIKSELGATRVLLIGSLAHDLWWDDESDVDLVVEGLRGDRYWEAWALAEDVIPGRQIELIALETAKPSLRRTVEAEGISL